MAGITERTHVIFAKYRSTLIGVGSFAVTAMTILAESAARGAPLFACS